MIKNSGELFKSRAKSLKDLGLADFDLRKKPTEYQKRKARELSHKYSEIINNPGKYSTVIVGNKTARNIDNDAARKKTKSGKTKLWVKTDGKALKVNSDHSIQVGKRGVDQIIHTYYKGGVDVFDTAQRLFKKLNIPDGIDKKTGEYDENFDRMVDVKKYVTIAIGDHNPFHRTIQSMEEFNHYITQFVPNDSKRASEEHREQLKQQLISRMVSVEVFSPEGFEGETADKRKNATRIYKDIRGNNGKKEKSSRKNRGH